MVGWFHGVFVVGEPGRDVQLAGSSSKNKGNFIQTQRWGASFIAKQGNGEGKERTRKQGVVRLAKQSDPWETILPPSFI
jgi:hypothetical protein